MPKLTDTQAILLSSASQRADGNLMPPSEALGAVTERVRKAVATLIKRTLAQEVEVTAADRAWRSEDERHWGAIITDAGRAAIGVKVAAVQAQDGAGKPTSVTSDGTAEPASPELRQTKAALVLTLLRRSGGATLPELTEATGWLPHTTRAALTGLRKKGHDIARSKRNEATCYTLAA